MVVGRWLQFLATWASHIGTAHGMVFHLDSNESVCPGCSSQSFITFSRKEQAFISADYIDHTDQGWYNTGRQHGGVNMGGGGCWDSAWRLTTTDPLECLQNPVHYAVYFQLGCV